MKLNLKLVVTVAIAALSITSCSNGEENIVLSPDLVHNSASASAKKSDEKVATMDFESKEKSFGTIVQGESVVLTYKFTNNGDADLIISAASGSCGCTIPNWPKKPIKKGKSGVIEVIFNSQGKENIQTKKVYITANTSPIRNVIVLKGEVVAPK